MKPLIIEVFIFLILKSFSVLDIDSNTFFFERILYNKLDIEQAGEQLEIVTEY